MNHRIPRKNLILLPAVAAVLFPALSPPSGAATDDPWDAYRVLVERNIFLRDRRRGWSPGITSTQPTTRESRDSDGNIVLTGTARRDGTFVAFFEDVRTNATSRVRVGQAIGKGKVKSITLDGVTYQRGDRVTHVEVGHSLMGAMAAAPANRTVASSTEKPDEPPRGRDMPTTAPAQPAANVAAAPNAPQTGANDARAADILEQMRRRRERELRR